MPTTDTGPHRARRMIDPMPDVEIEVTVRVIDGEDRHRMCFHAERVRPGDNPETTTVATVRDALAEASTKAVGFVARAYYPQAIPPAGGE